MIFLCKIKTYLGDGGDRDNRDDSGEDKQTSSKSQSPELGRKLKSKSVKVVSILCTTCSRLWFGSRSLLKLESGFGVGTMRII